MLKVREEPRSYDVCLPSRSVLLQNRRQLRQANSGKDAEAQQERATKWDNNQENNHTQFSAKYIASWWSVKPVRQPSVSKIVIVKLHERELNPILARLFWAPAARGAHCAPFWKPCSSSINSLLLSFSESLSKAWSHDTLWFPWQLF